MEEYWVSDKQKNCDTFPTRVRSAEFRFTKHDEGDMSEPLDVLGQDIQHYH